MRRMAALLLSAALLGACGASSDDEPAVASSASSSETSDGGDAAPTAEQETPTESPRPEFRSPIAEFLGTDFGLGERSEAEMRRLEAEAEEKTVECMQALGFEYVPVDNSSFISFSQIGEIDPGSDEWIETYGFGISTQRFPQSMVGPDLVGLPDEIAGGPFGPDSEFQDPNEEYVNSLSDTAREAYYEALHGGPPPFDPNMTEEEINEAMSEWVPSGCANEARQELFGGPFGGGPVAEFYDTFGDEMQNLYERVESDPRIVAAQTEVSACVAAEGLDWSGDMQDLFERFERDLRGIGDMMFDPFAGTDLDPAEMSQEELDEFFENLEPPTLSDEDKAVLARVQAEEVELAIAVRDCGGGPRDLEGLYNEVRIEYEQRFLDENAEAIEPFRDGG